MNQDIIFTQLGYLSLLIELEAVEVILALDSPLLGG